MRAQWKPEQLFRVSPLPEISRVHSPPKKHTHSEKRFAAPVLMMLQFFFPDYLAIKQSLPYISHQYKYLASYCHSNGVH